MNKTIAIAAMATIATLSPLSFAHVTLDQPAGQADTYHKLVFRVGHGCDGSPTKSITVMMPESVTGAKPMPKAGWKITTVQGKLSVPQESHGKAITTAVREVTWSGGPLADEHFDEFVVQAKLPAEPGKVYFKVIQQCVKGSVAWDELPGDAGVKLLAPAPVLTVVPASGPANAH
jgi:uncharacterized protein YcnI